MKNIAPRVRKINDKFYVRSRTDPDKFYELDKDLNCECKGFFRHNKCEHQQDVVKYILSGDWAPQFTDSVQDNRFMHRW